MKTTKKQLLERINVLERRIEEVHDHLLEGMGGGIWRTLAGHARGIAFLSTEHLNNILLFPGVSTSTLLLVI